jgi:hypothetical protein
VVIDGGNYCVECHGEGKRTPTDPDHPNSPYCVDHRRAAKTAAKAKWREREQHVQGLLNKLRDKGVHISPDGSVTISGEVVHVLLGDIESVFDTAMELAEAAGHASDTPSMIRNGIDDMSASMTSFRQTWVPVLTKTRRGRPATKGPAAP